MVKGWYEYLPVSVSCFSILSKVSFETTADMFSVITCTDISGVDRGSVLLLLLSSSPSFILKIGTGMKHDQIIYFYHHHQQHHHLSNNIPLTRVFSEGGIKPNISILQFQINKRHPWNYVVFSSLYMYTVVWMMVTLGSLFPKGNGCQKSVHECWYEVPAIAEHYTLKIWSYEGEDML